MADLDKVNIGLSCCGNLEAWSSKVCDRCPYNHSGTEHFGCEDHLVADALALMNERRAVVKPQFDDDALDRNAYIKIGDLIDLMEELSMPSDAAFHLTGAIEWACGKRAYKLVRRDEMYGKTSRLTRMDKEENSYADATY